MIIINMTKIHLRINTDTDLLDVGEPIEIIHTLTPAQDWVLDLNIVQLKQMFMSELRNSANLGA